MTGKINFKNMMMLLMILFSSVAMTSCIGNTDDGEEATPQKAEATGLCGGVWHLVELSNDFGMNQQIDENDTYEFSLTGEGLHQYTDPETGNVEKMNFTWKSYFFSGATNRLVLKYEKYGDLEFATIYTINVQGQLVMAVTDNNGDSCVAYYSMNSTTTESPKE